jgi:hypothetical protein
LVCPCHFIIVTIFTAHHWFYRLFGPHLVTWFLNLIRLREATIIRCLRNIGILNLRARVLDKRGRFSDISKRFRLLSAICTIDKNEIFIIIWHPLEILVWKLYFFWILLMKLGVLEARVWFKLVLLDPWLTTLDLIVKNLVNLGVHLSFYQLSKVLVYFFFHDLLDLLHTWDHDHAAIVESLIWFFISLDLLRRSLCWGKPWGFIVSVF